MTSTPGVPRDEVAAAVAARQELGPDLEPEIVDSLVDRIDRAIDARVAAGSPNTAWARRTETGKT